MEPQVICTTLCKRYRLVVLDKQKVIQRRKNVNWEFVETWPLLKDGYSTGGAINFMNTLAKLDGY